MTVLGGEPWEEENQKALLPFIEKFKKECPDKNIWMFTGYVWDKDLIPGGKKYVEGVTDKILDFVDVLVDGPFIKELKDLSLKFRGSKNQRLLTKEERKKKNK